jgi:hypothetical protein
VEVVLANRSGAVQALVLPVGFGDARTINMTNGEERVVGSFTRPDQVANVGLRALSAEGASAVPLVRVPVSFPDRWVCVSLYDASAQQWVLKENRFAPSDISIDNVQSGRWYWLGVWDFAENRWAFSDWFSRM